MNSSFNSSLNCILDHQVLYLHSRNLDPRSFQPVLIDLKHLLQLSIGIIALNFKVEWDKTIF